MKIQSIVTSEKVIRAAKARRTAMVGQAWDTKDPEQMEKFAEWFLDLLWEAMTEEPEEEKKIEVHVSGHQGLSRDSVERPRHHPISS